MKDLEKMFLPCFFVLLMAATFAYSQVLPDVSAGGQWWHESISWKDSDGNELAGIGPGNMFGGFVSVASKKWEYRFLLLFGSSPMHSFEWHNLDQNDLIASTMNRQDFSMQLGYKVRKNFSIFVIGKYMQWVIETSATEVYTDTLKPVQVIADYRWQENGFYGGVGIAGIRPFKKQGWFAYATLAVLAGQLTNLSKRTVIRFTDIRKEEETIPALHTSADIGLSYRSENKFGFQLGYRMDYLGTTYKKEIHSRMVSQGLHLSIFFPL